MTNSGRMADNHEATEENRVSHTERVSQGKSTKSERIANAVWSLVGHKWLSCIARICGDSTAFNGHKKSLSAVFKCQIIFKLCDPWKSGRYYGLVQITTHISLFVCKVIVRPTSHFYCCIVLTFIYTHIHTQTYICIYVFYGLFFIIKPWKLPAVLC